MRNYVCHVLGVVSLVFLGGCVPEMDLDFKLTDFQNKDKTPWGTTVTDPEPGNPYPLYVFPALRSGAPDFALHLTNPGAFKSREEFDKAPGHSNRLIVAAVYSTTCENCAEHAVYFERLAKQFQATELEFAILFADNDREAVARLDYVQKLQDVKVYYNSDDFCQNGLCTYPTKALTAWVADSKREMLTDTGFDVSPDEKSAGKQDEIYAAYFQLTLSFLKRHKNSGISVILELGDTYNFDITL